MVINYSEDETELLNNSFNILNSMTEDQQRLFNGGVKLSPDKISFIPSPLERFHSPVGNYPTAVGSASIMFSIVQTHIREPLKIAFPHRRQVEPNQLPHQRRISRSHIKYPGCVRGTSTLTGGVTTLPPSTSRPSSRRMDMSAQPGESSHVISQVRHTDLQPRSSPANRPYVYTEPRLLPEYMLHTNPYR